jgi:hypothetical protein
VFKMQKDCCEIALKLMQLWPVESSIYYDEVLGETHERVHDGFEISTDYLDYTTYFVSQKNGQIEVGVKRLDNYKRHEKAKFSDSAMADDDWLDLHEILTRLVQNFEALIALEKVDLKTEWLALQNALFAEAAPAKLPNLQKNPHQLAQTLCATLKKHKRLVQFEWKNWDEQGVMATNKLAALQTNGLKIAYPDAQTCEAVMNSDDFSQAVLSWFDAQLSPHNMTLIAISPIDEDQIFGVVPTSTIAQLQAGLQTLCIHYRMSDHYLA